MNFTALDKSFSLLFFIILVIELMSTSIEGVSSLHNVAKPLIIVSLFYFSYLNRSKVSKKTFFYLKTALTLSLIGDLSILLEGKIDGKMIFFLVGLICFLGVIILYSVIFQENQKKSKKYYGLLAGLSLYIITLFYFFGSKFGNLLWPILFYSVVLMYLIYTTSIRASKMNKLSYYTGIIGSILLLCSNTLIAVNKFVIEISFAHELIMMSYAIAQYCLVMSIIKSSNALSYSRYKRITEHSLFE